MTDPVPEAPTPTAQQQPGPPPAADLGAALTQMAGLVLSRKSVDTALELVTSLAATATAGTLGAGVTVVDEHGKRSGPPRTRPSRLPTLSSTSSTKDRA